MVLGEDSDSWQREVPGNGKCPKPSSRIQYGIKKCNAFDCKDGEVCIAHRDLVLASDARGSLRVVEPDGTRNQCRKE